MPTERRRPGGGAVDRNEPVDFLFNGRAYRGLRGDTLASALQANGVRVVARSFKYHRPRGVVGLGLEEPNAMVRVLAPRAEPMALATTLLLEPGLSVSSVNCWPGPAFDVGAAIGWLHRLLPAGFYYKTFMAPAGAWHFYERIIRRAAGLGVVDAGDRSRAGARRNDGLRSDGASPAVDASAATDRPAAPTQHRRYAHCDLLVVGAGPAGTAAALVAGRSGARVIFADDRAEAGGTLPFAADSGTSLDWIAAAVAELGVLPNVRRLSATQVFGYHDHGFLTAIGRHTPGLECLWKIRARQVVIATGAAERPLLFPDNDRPGVMLASAVLGYLLGYAVACGERVLVACNNNGGYEAAFELVRHGIGIAAIVDVRREIHPALAAQARALGVTVKLAHTITAVRGRRSVRGARIAPRDAPGQGFELRCDLIAMSGGWSPVVHLHSQSGGKVVYDAARACFAPGAPAQPSRCAGSANARFDTLECFTDGLAAGTAAVRALGLAPRPVELPALAPGLDLAVSGGWALPCRADQRAFVDFANDVTTHDLALAQREGYESVELVKRYTTVGMGIDQGKTANVNAIGVMAELRGVSPAAIGTTTFRPPYAPVRFGAIAGNEPGLLIRPARRTPMTGWHEARGAVMYESGANWRRPGYYPQAGETMAGAVVRECLAVRERAGIYDSTPLGKIEVRGPTAGAFLEWVCAGNVANLQPGRGRYGLMLREDARLLDDGVVFRLAPDHYWVSTTSGNADAVYAWLEYLRQRVWTEPVFVVPVTAQWSNAVVCGPRARDVLRQAGTGIDLAGSAFPFMSVREGGVANLPARVFRVSFTGELSYEINVPARHGLALWEALFAAGREHAMEPVGSEANHVLRIEKGYLSLGHEADGMASPDDLGLGWAVNHAKRDFIGKRSLARHDDGQGVRRQRVGLHAADPRYVLAEGAQILSADGRSSAGHVTASVMSPTLGRSIALALLDDGRRRVGETVRVTVTEGTGLTDVAAVVTRPVFHDPGGEKLRG